MFSRFNDGGFLGITRMLTFFRDVAYLSFATNRPNRVFYKACYSNKQMFAYLLSTRTKDNEDSTFSRAIG